MVLRSLVVSLVLLLLLRSLALLLLVTRRLVEAQLVFLLLRLSPLVRARLPAQSGGLRLRLASGFVLPAVVPYSLC